jgi:hypothetical protein
MSTSVEASTTTISREELYDLVWTMPMMRLADIYDISDVGLAKMCRRLRVPRPPVGYWQRVAVGQKISRTPLRAVPRGLETRLATVTLRGRIEQPDQVETSFMQRIRAFEEAPENRIEVPTGLESAPKIVKRTVKELRPRKRRVAYSDYYGPPRDPVRDILDLRVTEPTLPRALRIMSALVHAFEQRGLMVVSEPPTKGPVAELWRRDQDREWNNDRWRPLITLVLFPDEYVRIFMRELKTKPKVATGANAGKGIQESVGKDQLVLTASFSLRDSWGERAWKETAHRRLETMLNDVMIDLFGLVEERRENRARWAEEARLKRVEDERRWRGERRRSRVAARDEENLRQADSWARAKQLVNFADEAVRLSVDFPMGSDRDRYMRAVARLRRTARRLDPLLA